ncbi:replication initiation protein [Castellaniella defragrans]|uniref:replication initiation protein n=1 Tax=Castellaniella defragrans TaxID=75697 RepID=UPI000693F964|nr:replication initiation protein [Castellaniella defragrans]
MYNNNQKNQFKEFKNNLSAKPYCSDDLNYGLIIRPEKQASTKRYIQHNSPLSHKFFVFDCDYKNALEYADDNNLPLPNLVAINRENGHSHLFYDLEVPVLTCSNARKKPLQYASAIENTLTKALKADKNYSGLICKNPLNDYWLTFQVRAENYTLQEFEEYLDIESQPTKKQNIQEAIGLGRNCAVFDLLRSWAYTNFCHYSTQDNFFQACIQQASSYNQFTTPLSLNEIKAIAKSVSKWVWKNFDIEIREKKFISLQSYRGKLGGRPKTTTKEGKPWELAGISRATWYRKKAA